MVKRPIRSVIKIAYFTVSDTRITNTERELGKVTRSEEFFRLRQGEFTAFSDGRGRKMGFLVPMAERDLPKPKHPESSPEIMADFQRIPLYVKNLFQKSNASFSQI